MMDYNSEDRRQQSHAHREQVHRLAELYAYGANSDYAVAIERAHGAAIQVSLLAQRERGRRHKNMLELCSVLHDVVNLLDRRARTLQG